MPPSRLLLVRPLLPLLTPLLPPLLLSPLAIKMPILAPPLAGVLLKLVLGSAKLQKVNVSLAELPLRLTL